MSWSGLFNFVFGVMLALALIVGGGAITVRYLITRLTTPPPKPVFPNDKPISASPKPTVKPQTVPSSPSPTPETPEASPSPTPTPSPGTYQARVTQERGLVLRSSPSTDAERIGGITFNEQVTILEESPDGQWQRVRVEGSSREGWVKAGNVERVTPNNQPEQQPLQ